MRIRLFAAFAALLCVLLLCACGEARLSQEVVDLDDFSVTVAEGWEYTLTDGEGAESGIYLRDNSGSVLQIRTGGSGVTEEENLELINEFKENYNGTELDEAELYGLTFYSTVYDTPSGKQTFYSAVKDGKQINIMLSGVGYMDNSAIAAMISTITLK